MQIFREIAPLKAFLVEKRASKKSVGLVPTMGALHKGHLKLVEASKAENSVTIATIYINPAQFNNPDDLKKYPRTQEKDFEMLEASGCDAVFCPENSEMYSTPSIIKFDFGDLDKSMEGQFRPGHFSGVALVVSKLFNIVQPDKAYFGQKDWQQYAIIARLCEELKFNLKLISVETVRENDGLAMSSRNMRLTPTQRQKAIVLSKALKSAKEKLNNGEGIAETKSFVRNLFEHDSELKLEYFEVADSTNLNPLNHVEESAMPILCIAAFVGEVRLIDNMFL